MEFERLSAPSLKELFVTQIRDNILSGKLPVGTRLPPEREIAQQMQVSRAVVNGGLAELEHEGFIEIRPRQGAYVADYGRSGNIDTLISIMEYCGETLGKAEIRSILEVRRALEHLATDAAIENAAEQDMNALGERLADIGAANTIPEAIEMTFAFHHELSIIGGNSILPLIYTSFKPIVSQLWMRFCRRYGMDALYDSTQHLYECLCTRDREAARRATDAALDCAIRGDHQIY